MRRLAWILAPALAGLGLLTLGIPGAILFEGIIGVLELVSGQPLRARVPPDSAWPIAIYLSLLWPFSLPVAAHLAAAQPTRRKRALIYGTTVVLLCTALTLFFYRLAL